MSALFAEASPIGLAARVTYSFKRMPPSISGERKAPPGRQLAFVQKDPNKTHMTRHQKFGSRGETRDTLRKQVAISAQPSSSKNVGAAPRPCDSAERERTRRQIGAVPNACAPGTTAASITDIRIRKRSLRVRHLTSCFDDLCYDAKFDKPYDGKLDMRVLRQTCRTQLV